MPGQEILESNPSPDASLLPDTILDLSVKLDTKDYLSDDELKAVQHFSRAANYIAAGALYKYFLELQLNEETAMIFLKDNVYLKDKLCPDHIKPRLLGHWGTCPGLSLIYAHLNRYAKCMSSRDTINLDVA